MGYLFLFLALAFGLTKAYCGKKTSVAADRSYSAILINTVRMVLCIFVSLLLVLVSGGALIPSPKVILIALLCGIGTACFTVSWLLAVRTMAYMLVEVFVMAGVLIPLTLSAVLYKEPIKGVQLVGIVLLLAAVYCMCTYKRTEKFRLAGKDLLLLLLCALSSGVSDLAQKLYVKEIENADVTVFNLYTYLFAGVVLLTTCCIIRTKEKAAREIPTPREVIGPIFHHIAIMAVCLFLNAYFKTLAAGYLDAVLLYPLNQGCAVVLSLIMSVAIFKEKINVKGIFGVALSVVSMILINVSAIV